MWAASSGSAGSSKRLEVGFDLPDPGEELDEDGARHRFQLGLTTTPMRASPSEKADPDDG
jgi:hypothetical protein